MESASWTLCHAVLFTKSSSTVNPSLSCSGSLQFLGLLDHGARIGALRGLAQAPLHLAWICSCSRGSLPGLGVGPSPSLGYCTCGLC